MSMKKNLIISCLILLFFISAYNVSARCVVCLSSGGVTKCFIFQTAVCADGGMVSGSSGTYNGQNGPVGVACKDYRVTVKNPIIKYDLKGLAVLIDGEEIINIASDYLESGFKKTDKNDTKGLELLFQNDNNIVSLKRLEAMAKEMNAAIVKVDQLPVATYCRSCLGGDKAPPDDNRITTKEKFGGTIGGPIVRNKAIVLSIGAGFNAPGSTTKRKSNALGDIQFVADLYIPLAPISNNVNFGFSTNFQYAVGTGNYTADDYNVYNIQGQASAPTIQARGSGSPRQAGFRGVVSPQISAGAKRTILRGGFGFGYMTMTQQQMSVIQTSQNGPQTNEYKLLNQSESKAKGLVLMPSLRLSHHYKFGRNNRYFSIWAEGQYLMGPEIENNATKFIPQGTANQNGNYTLTQMEMGTNVPFVRERVKYKSFGVNVGVGFSLGKPGGPKHVTLIRKNTSVPNHGQFGYCPGCGHRFSDFDEAYSHSCLKIKNEEIFNSYATWLKDEWNGEISDLFNLPPVYTAIPASTETLQHLRELFKKNTATVEMIDSNLKIVSQVKNGFITEVLSLNPNPPVLAHILGVKITCIGSCPNGCTVTNSSGTYFCQACPPPNTGYQCKEIIEGAFGHYHENLLEYALTANEMSDSENPETILNNKEIINACNKILPNGFKPIKAQLVNEKGNRLLLLQCVAESKSVILINRLFKNKISNKWLLVQNDKMPTTGLNLQEYVEKNRLTLNLGVRRAAVQNIKAEQMKQEGISYLGHVTLIR